MPSFYWIKLYHEILDDPKMALLPDRVWRRTVELFLLAGKHGKDGDLPDARQIAWELRQQPDEISLDLVQIEHTGIIEKTLTGWRVVNFANRQAAVPGIERKRQQRERGHKEQYEDVTPLSRDCHDASRRLTDIESDTDTDTEAEQIAPPAVIPLTPEPKNGKTATASSISNFNLGISQRCEMLYQRITGQVSIPTSSKDTALQSLEMILDNYKGDPDAAYPVGRNIFLTWCKTQSLKTGKFYSRTNTAWLDRWIEMIAPEPEQATREETEDERIATVVRQLQERMKVPANVRYPVS